MKKLILTLFLVLCLTGCSGYTDLMPNASPETSALALYVCDSETTARGFLFDDTLTNQVLADLHKVKGKPVENVDVSALTPPYYALEIGGKDGWPVTGIWAGGYFFTANGTAYALDCDFAAVQSDYPWENWDSFPSPTVMPNFYYLVRTEDGWNQNVLSPAQPLKDAPEGVTMTLTEQTADGLTVEYGNNGDSEWDYGLYYAVQVQLDGQWYEVPTVPGINWGIPDIACIVSPGSTSQETYSLKPYGQLPEGIYRLTAENMTVEFEV